MPTAGILRFEIANGGCDVAGPGAFLDCGGDSGADPTCRPPRRGKEKGKCTSYTYFVHVLR